jgi:serine/threonine protein kinase/tetratricopeptide (TPR) repeat protein
LEYGQTLIGRRLGHYVILEPRGRGGMGEVYTAEDTKLERRVALKLLRSELADVPDRRTRFQREARAAAALNHPNIVHLYSVEEAEGLLFITMELVPGRSLRELLDAGAPLPIPRTLALATQMAEGLACAHAAGILHRDLKPGNVMITDDDRVKILDFGLAKLLARPELGENPEAVTMTGALSRTGTTFGTAGYMSPEQALGKPLDQRSDLFALGVVLFEMATGKAPFPGETLAAVFDQLLNRRPAAPQTLNPAVPTFLANVIDKAIEKEPGRRYQSAGEFLVDLKEADASGTRVTAAMTVPGDTRRPSSIVVLPFADMSQHKDQEYFCHGVTEEIISALTRVPGLRVISRTSAFAFQGRDLDVTEIGRRLRVDTALEGSVRRAGDRVRVTAQLVNADDGYQIWSRRFDRELSDVLAIQDEIAATIVKELRPEPAAAETWVRPAAAEAPGERKPFDAAAHDAYLKGMYALNKWSGQAMEQAIADFRRAIAKDPRFAPAYAGLAEGLVWLYSGIGILPASETVPQARWAVEQALALDPTLADAHNVRGLIAMNHDWDRRGAEDALARALELGPGSAAAHLSNAWRLLLLERHYDRAHSELEEAERLSPLDLQVKTLIGYFFHFRHDFDRAIEQFERVLALEPSFAFAHYALGDACTQINQFERAIKAFEKAIELGGRSVNHVGVLGYAHGRAGNRDRAQALLEELTSRASKDYVPAMWIALVHLGISDLDGLFRWLDRAWEDRDGSLILISAAVEFDAVREDPRFKSLLARMGMAHLASPISA